jgi:HEAT repeat protein
VFGPNVKKLEKRGDVAALIELCDERREEWSERWRAFSSFAEEHRYDPGRSALTTYDPVEVPGGAALKRAENNALRSLQRVEEALVRLARLGDARAIEYVLGHGDQDAVAELEGQLEPGAVIDLLRAGGDAAARAAAAHRLGGSGAAEAAEALVAALADEDPRVRGAAADALSERGELTTETLGAQLRSRYPGMRSWAADALGERGGEEAADLLSDALGDEEPEVRDRVALALGKLGDPRAVGPLITVLKRRGRDAWTALLLLREADGPEVEEAFAEGTPKVGDTVRVAFQGDVYAGMPGDRAYMGKGTVGEWSGAVKSVSAGGAAVECEKVEGEVDDTTPGRTRRMQLDPRHASQDPADPSRWIFEL